MTEINKSGKDTIAIDGYMSAGKTFLSDKLKTHIKKKVFRLDEYRKDSIHFNENVYQSLEKTDLKIIVEGIESIKICQRYDSVINIFVEITDYCKCPSSLEIVKLGNKSNWDRKTMFNYLNQERDQNPKVDFSLDERSIEYFVNFRPFEKTDIIYNELNCCSS